MLKDALDSANDSRWHYRDFQWRLDIAISSKSTREIFKPIVNAALKIQQPSANKDAQTQLFEMDLSFLRNLEHVLEDAVQAAGSKEARRGARIGI